MRQGRVVESDARKGITYNRKRDAKRNGQCTELSHVPVLVHNMSHSEAESHSLQERACEETSGQG